MCWKSTSYEAESGCQRLNRANRGLFHFLRRAENLPHVAGLAWRMQQSLPSVRVPLANGDLDATLDLQDIFTTILALVAGSDNALPWTKPEDLAFNQNAPVACLGNLGTSLIFAFADGSVNTAKPYLPPEFVKELMSPDGGQPPPKGSSNYGCAISMIG